MTHSTDVPLHDYLNAKVADGPHLLVGDVVVGVLRVFCLLDVLEDLALEGVEGGLVLHEWLQQQP